MSSIESSIQRAAAHNSELLGILSQTDYAPPALEQQRRYIADVKNEIQQLDKQIKELETKRQKELKDHEKYRDSVMKRFAYKVGRKTDKFEAKASKEEREYFDVLHDEHKAKEMRKSLDANLAQANSAKQDLEGVTARHTKAQQDLDDLYDSIFDGPTPGFPEEDEKEQNAKSALQRYHDLRVQTEAEQQAAHILNDAAQKMSWSMRAMQEALSYSRMDMFGGGMMSDMMERDALNKTELLAMEAQNLVLQAQRMSPVVRPLPPLNIAKGSIMSDVLFDNIFTDMAFHDKIKASNVEVENAFNMLRQQQAMVQDRHQSQARELSQAARALEEARVSMQKAREMAFERVAGARA